MKTLDDLIIQLMQYGPGYKLKFKIDENVMEDFEIKLTPSFDLEKGELLEIEFKPNTTPLLI
jgi:hypothetical protein